MSDDYDEYETEGPDLSARESVSQGAPGGSVPAGDLIRRSRPGVQEEAGRHEARETSAASGPVTSHASSRGGSKKVRPSPIAS